MSPKTRIEELYVLLAKDIASKNMQSLRYPKKVLSGQDQIGTDIILEESENEKKLEISMLNGNDNKRLTYSLVIHIEQNRSLVELKDTQYFKKHDQLYLERTSRVFDHNGSIGFFRTPRANIVVAKPKLLRRLPVSYEYYDDEYEELWESIESFIKVAGESYQSLKALTE